MEKIDYIQGVLFANVFMTFAIVFFISTMRDEVNEFISRYKHIEWKSNILERREEDNFKFGLLLDERVSKLEKHIENERPKTNSKNDK